MKNFLFLILISIMSTVNLFAQLQQDAEGWTIFTPTNGHTRIIYVSSSEGDDAMATPIEVPAGGLAFDPFNPSPGDNIKAYKTVNAGLAQLRHGYADWILFKRGDEWVNEIFDAWKKEGKSLTEPMLVSNYGDVSLERPLFKCGSQNFLRTYGGGGTPPQLDNLAFVGLHLYAHTRDPQSPDYQSPEGRGMISLLQPGDNILFEDNYFDSTTGLDIQSIGNIKNFTFRRNVVVDNYSSGDGHSQGIYIAGVVGLTFEENIFDHNGWNEQLGVAATKFNHNIYLQKNITGKIVVKGNYAMRGSSHGLQLRSGGVAQNNIFIGNGIAGFVAGDRCTPASGLSQVMKGNVVLHGSKHVFTDGGARGWGIELKGGVDCTASIYSENIVAHGENCVNPFGETPTWNYQTYNNIVYKWGDDSDPGPFPDPERNILTYQALLGRPQTLNDFYTEVRKQRKGYWREEYTHEVVIDYIRAGFGLEPLNTLNDIEVEGVQIYPTSLTLATGDTQLLNASITPADATVQNISWDSSNPAVATVTGDGLVTGISNGTATITVTVDGHTSQINVTVNDNWIPVTHIQVEEISGPINVGGTYQVVVTVFPENASNKDYELIIANPYIATISPTGLITGIRSGETNVKAIALDNLASDFKDFVVSNNGFISVDYIDLTPENSIIPVNGTQQIDAVLSPDNATDPVIKWNSSNTNIATVNENGLVLGVSPGTAIITAVSAINWRVSDNVTVIVDGIIPPVNVTAIGLIPLTSSIGIGGNIALTANITPSNATNQNITWTSSDPNVVISGTGLTVNITANALPATNPVTITATTEDGGFIATAEVEVIAPISVTGITVDPTSILLVGANVDIWATIQPSNATNQNITWSSNDANAVISGSGLSVNVSINAMPSNNPVIITATTVDGGFTATTEIVINTDIPVTDITVNPAVSVLDVGENVNLIATITPTNATNQNVTWASSDPNVTVTGTGLSANVVVNDLPLTDVITITVTTEDGNLTATSLITINDNEAPIIDCSVLSEELVCGAPIPDYTSLVSVTDNNDITEIVLSQSPAPGTVFMGQDIDITATDPAGNSNNCSFSLTMVSSIEVDSGNDVVITEGDETTLTATSNSDGTYLWTPSTGLSTPGDPTTFASPITTTTYTVTFTSTEGCVDTDEITVTVNPLPEEVVKQGFSPNNDGIHDFWEISGIEQYPDNNVKIYDRWGNLVFEMNGYDNASNYFDGSANRSQSLGAGDLPEGTYFFKIETKGSNTFNKSEGYLVLKR